MELPRRQLSYNSFFTYGPPTASTRDYAMLSDSSDELERRQRLIEGTLFSKWFILTYHVALCGVLLIFIMWHWQIRFSMRRQRNMMRWRHKQTLVPPESTGEGTSERMPSYKAMKAITTAERIPLLPDKQQRSDSLNLVRRGIRRLRSFGMYQPRPIPLINKTLPCNSQTLIIIALLGLNIFYATYNIHWSLDFVFLFSDRCGLLFVANLPWLYLLGAKNQPIKIMTGYSYENLNILHRRLGELLCLVAVFHAIGMFMVWYYFLATNGMDFWMWLSHRIIIIGLLAFVCYEALYLTSLASFREWWYEFFLGSHILLQSGALVFVFFHHHCGRVYTATALAIFLIDRLVLRVSMKRRTVRADLAILEDGGTVLVSADWPISRYWDNAWSFLLGLDVSYGWKPSEHVFLTIPALGTKHNVQAHPFTIASAAPENGKQHAWFNLIIRARDGFSQDLLLYAKQHSSAMICLDGPYGSLHALEMLRNSDIVLLIAGGSGIAVGYPLIWTLLHEGDPESVHPQRKVGLIWTVHEASHVSWLGCERLEDLEEKGLHLHITAPTNKTGRPDIAALLRSMVNDIINTEELHDPRVGVVVSGPDGMNRVTRNACARMAREGMDVDVVVEKYGW